jgi:hypothetical protein
VGGVKKVDVTFIEFGNTERLLPHQIRTRLPDELKTLKDLPQFCLEMKLAHVRPVNDTDKWVDETIVYMHECLMGHTVCCRIANDYVPGDLLEVDRCQRVGDTRIEGEDSEVPDLGQMMVWSKKAEWNSEQRIFDEVPRPASLASKGSSRAGSQLGNIDDDNDDRQLADSLRDLRLTKGQDVVPEGYVKTPSKRFMRMTAPDGVDFHYHIQVWGTEGFYYQYYIDHPQYDSEPILMEKKKECLESIQYEKFMQSVAGTWPSMNYPVKNLACAAFWHDKKWYRAQIVEPPTHDYASGKAQVAFVDWGNTDKVKVSDLRYIPNDGLIPRRRSTRGLPAELDDLSLLTEHEEVKSISQILSRPLHGILSKIDKAITGGPQVYLTMCDMGHNEFVLKDFVAAAKKKQKPEENEEDFG